jgi:type I restriction enzyme S subunit
MEMKLVTINDIYSALVKGVNFDKSDATMNKANGYTPLLRANNISDMRINLDGLMYVKSNLVKKEQYLQNGDIIFVTSSGSKHLVGKSALVSGLPTDITIGAFNSLLRFSENIDARYVFYALNSPLFKAHMASRLAGANINNIKKNDILDFELLVPYQNDKPNLKEQKRIADKFDTVFFEVGKGKEMVAKQLAHFDNLKASMLSSVFAKK